MGYALFWNQIQKKKMTCFKLKTGQCAISARRGGILHDTSQSRQRTGVPGDASRNALRHGPYKEVNVPKDIAKCELRSPSRAWSTTRLGTWPLSRIVFERGPRPPGS